MDSSPFARHIHFQAYSRSSVSLGCTLSQFHAAGSELEFSLLFLGYTTATLRRKPASACQKATFPWCCSSGVSVGIFNHLPASGHGGEFRKLTFIGSKTILALKSVVISFLHAHFAALMLTAGSRHFVKFQHKSCSSGLVLFQSHHGLAYFALSPGQAG